MRSEADIVPGSGSRLVVVEGEGGIGKTTVVEAALEAVRDWIVVRASGEDAESGMAWSVVGQVVEGIGRRLGGRRRPLPVGGADPLAVGAGIVAHLEALTEQGATVLLLEDLHWCDMPSAAALLFALRRLDSVPLLTLATIRPPFPGPLGESWRRLIMARGQVVHLGGMSAAELSLLAASLGRPVSPAAAKRVWQHTGGHPLWASALLEELDLTTLESSAGFLPVPRDLAGAIRARHASLDAAARTVVAAASVLGDRFASALLASLAGVAEPARPIEEAIAAGLLVDTSGGAGTGTTLRFAHPLVRLAIYQDLGPARRSQLHSKAAQLTSGSEALGHLADATLAPSDAVAAELEAAGVEELGGNRLALAQLHLDAAVSLSPVGPHRDRRVLRAVEAHLWAGEPSRARVYADEVAAAPPGPYREYVLGSLARSEGRFGDASELFGRASEHLEQGEHGAPASLHVDGSEELRAKVAVALAALAVLRMAPDEAVSFARTALATGAAIPAIPVARAVEIVAMALGGACEPALESASSGPAAGVELHELVARGIVRLWSDDLLGAYDDLGNAVERWQGGEALRLMQPLAFLADACFRLARMPEASHHAEVACDIVDTAGREADRVVVHTRAGYAAAAMGDFARAEMHAAAIARLGGRIGAADSALDRVQAAARAASGVTIALALARDDPESLLGAARLATALTGGNEPGAFAFGPVLPEALVALGRLDEGEAALQGYEALASKTGRRSALAGAARVRGALCAAKGDRDGSLGAFKRAVAQAAGLPLELARCHYGYGKALVTQGAFREAQTQLEAARAVFARGGAAAFVNLVDDVLTEVRPLVPAGWNPPLTPSERAVARLAAQRLSNPEIAERLVVSRKTIEYHLSHVYAKLGISTRRQLVELFDRPDGGTVL